MNRYSKLMAMYNAMGKEFGQSHWWPGEGAIEIMLGAILTQNTAWTNVEKAIANLKTAKLLNPEALREISPDELAELIRPAGYFRVKAGYIKALIAWIFDFAEGSPENLTHYKTYVLREQLLGVKGIGPETADAILLYAFERPAFVVDEYTRRIFSRHGLVPAEINYQDLRDFFTDVLPEDTELYNEYHARIVKVGKQWCKRQKTDCQKCPLFPFLEQDFYA